MSAASGFLIRLLKKSVAHFQLLFQVCAVFDGHLVCPQK